MKYTKGKCKVHPSLKAVVIIGDNIRLTQSVIHTGNLDKDFDPIEEGNANAERIVKTWNSYDQLVSALKQAESEIIDANLEVPRYIILALRDAE